MFLNWSTCFGRHTAHHQELKTVIAASGFTHVFGFRLPLRCLSYRSGNRQPKTYVKPESALTVLSSWWWAVCRPKHVDQLRNIGIINSTTRLHLVISFYENYITMHARIHGHEVHEHHACILFVLLLGTAMMAAAVTATCPWIAIYGKTLPTCICWVVTLAQNRGECSANHIVCSTPEKQPPGGRVGSRPGENTGVGIHSACDSNRTWNLRMSIWQPGDYYASSEVRIGVPEPLPSGLY